MAAPDAAKIAEAIRIADIVHELRRTRCAPVYQVHKGAVATCHAAAISFGWLAPLKHSPSLLKLTDVGLAALVASGRI